MLEIPTLSARELDIAPLLVANATRGEIARHLGISEETVKHHTRNILRKFEATNVRDAFETLSEHLYVFGKEGLGVNYFSTASNVTCICKKIALMHSEKKIIRSRPFIHH